MTPAFAGLAAPGYRDVGLTHWLVSESAAYDRIGAALADGHYSRRKVGAPQFMPPGQRFVLLARDFRSVWGWWRPHPDSGIRAMNGLDGWTCTIFRRTGGARASELVIDAERAIAALGFDCGPHGLLTYIWDRKVASRNPGYCYKLAGWHIAGRCDECSEVAGGGAFRGPSENAATQALPDGWREAVVTLIYAEDGVRLYRGDCRGILGHLDLSPSGTVIITDPVWPNAQPGLFGVAEPYALFLEVAALFPAVCRRAVVQLGCNSDPRFLSAVPASMPFVRACWLRYACPSYAGTVLKSGDVAYVFGSHEGPHGKTVLPGEYTSTASRGAEADHPTPRKLDHVAWLIGNFTKPTDIVVDPFAGSGTMLLAAKNAGRRAVGIEISPTYCLEVQNRLRQMVLPLGGGAA
jgi:hypothetical protein